MSIHALFEAHAAHLQGPTASPPHRRSSMPMCCPILVGRAQPPPRPQAAPPSSADLLSPPRQAPGAKEQAQAEKAVFRGSGSFVDRGHWTERASRPGHGSSQHGKRNSSEHAAGRPGLGPIPNDVRRPNGEKKQKQRPFDLHADPSS